MYWLVKSENWKLPILQVYELHDDDKILIEMKTKKKNHETFAH